MRVLGLDAAAGGCSAALWQDGRVLARRLRPMTRGQAEALLPLVAEVLDEAGEAGDVGPGGRRRLLAGIDRIGVTIGPGSFTGVRIGLAAARGLALAAACPTVGVTTLAALAAATPLPAGPAAALPAALLVVLDTRRGDLYAQWFSAVPGGWSAAAPPAVATPVSLLAAAPAPTFLVAGDGAGALQAAGPGRVICPAGMPTLPDAAVVAALAAAQDPAAAPALPLYLRAPEARPAVAARPFPAAGP